MVNFYYLKFTMSIYFILLFNFKFSFKYWNILSSTDYLYTLSKHIVYIDGILISISINFNKC